MKVFATSFFLLAALTAVLGQNEEEVVKPKPVGVIYLIQLLNQPSEIQKSEEINVIPHKIERNSQETNNNIHDEVAVAREKRSPGYGHGGGGVCNVCGGGGGGYPGHGGGGHGGGGRGGGGGYGSSGSWSQSSSSAGSWGNGGGYGKGK